MTRAMLGASSKIEAMAQWILIAAGILFLAIAIPVTACGTDNDGVLPEAEVSDTDGGNDYGPFTIYWVSETDNRGGTHSCAVALSRSSSGRGTGIWCTE